MAKSESCSSTLPGECFRPRRPEVDYEMAHRPDRPFILPRTFPNTSESACRRAAYQGIQGSQAILTQLKGLQSLQYILVGSTQDLGGYGFSEFFDTKGRLGNFGLPPACEVQIRVRRLLRPGETAPPPGQVEQIPDRLLALMEQARRQILDR